MDGDAQGCHLIFRRLFLTIIRFTDTSLQQEVRALREELAHEESRYHYLQCMLKVQNVLVGLVK